MKRLAITAALAGFFVAAMALPGFVKVFESTYKIPAGSALAKAKCMTCHASKSGGKLNPYGVDLKKAMGASKTLTAAVLHKIDALDSDKDGKKNAAEIKAGTLPGAK